MPKNVILTLPNQQEPMTVGLHQEKNVGKALLLEEVVLVVEDISGRQEFPVEVLFYQRHGDVIEATIRYAGRCHRLFAAVTFDKVFLWLDGRHYSFHRQAPQRGQQRATDHGLGGNVVTAPMPGKILQVLVEPTAHVTLGQPVIVMESMKMELTLSAPQTGQVLEIQCAAGQTVDMNAVLLTLEVDNTGETLT